jgi:hypothetical protein
LKREEVYCEALEWDGVMVRRVVGCTRAREREGERGRGREGEREREREGERERGYASVRGCIKRPSFYGSI